MSAPDRRYDEWPLSRVARLRLMAPTMTTREIAKALGCTRNAVIGKCHRANISLEAWNTVSIAP